MRNELNILKSNSIFRDVNEEEFNDIIKFNKTKIVEYSKNEIVAIEDSVCDSIGIVLEGCVEIQKLYACGRSLTIQRLIKGGAFGEAVVFSSRNTYPATIVASCNSKVIFISRENIIELCVKNKEFLSNFMALLSGKIFVLNNKIKNMSFKSIRQKVANYLLEESMIQNSKRIKLSISKKELAEYLAMPRPSLSRELIKMKDEGILMLNKREIYILRHEDLENIMLK